MQPMLILSVTTQPPPRPDQALATCRQRPIKHCKCFTPNISCLDTRLISWSHKRPCLITAHFRWLADTGNGPLVLHPGHPPPPPDPRGRHLHRRGRPLPLDEGDDDQTIRRHCPCIIVILSGRSAVWSSCRFILTSWEQGNTWPFTSLAPDPSSSLTQLKS